MRLTQEQTARLADRLARCYSGAVYDVLRERGLPDSVLPHDIRPIDESMVVAGPVFGLVGSPRPGVDADTTMLRWTEFLSAVPPDHVVVCEGRDPDRALMGELSAEALKLRGVRGYLTDGGCRDCGFIRSIAFPVFARFRTPRDVVAAWVPDAVGVAVRIGNVTISPGDWLIADIDGAVAIPGAVVAEVVAEVEAVVATESAVRKAIRAGMDPKEAYLAHGRF